MSVVLGEQPEEGRVPRVVVLDANVLYPAQLRDLRMRLAVAGLIRVHWTDEIHEEWTRAVRARHPDVAAGADAGADGAGAAGGPCAATAFL